MKMFLTRFGENSRMVVCGDPKQTDLPRRMNASGLNDAVGRLEGVEGIAIMPVHAADVVRHPIVGRIVEAYEGRMLEVLSPSPLGEKDWERRDLVMD
jgi:phosphate starvation-inducible PhoH-like protein